jgi:hypothetical protein
MTFFVEMRCSQEPPALACEEVSVHLYCKRGDDDCHRMWLFRDGTEVNLSCSNCGLCVNRRISFVDCLFSISYGGQEEVRQAVLKLQLENSAYPVPTNHNFTMLTGHYQTWVSSLRVGSRIFHFIKHHPSIRSHRPRKHTTSQDSNEM